MKIISELILPRISKRMANVFAGELLSAEARVTS